MPRKKKAQTKNSQETTSKTVASKAAKILKDPDSSPEAKSVAASALTQAADKKEKAKPKMELLVGVNFRVDGEKEETRIEAGMIEHGTLPPAFEKHLREKGQLK